MSDLETHSATVLKDRSAFQNRISALVNALPTVVRNPLRKLKYRFFGPPKLLIVEVFVIRFSMPPSFPDATMLDVRRDGPRASRMGDTTSRFLVLPVTNSAAFRRELADVPGARVISSQQVHAFSGHGAQVATLANPVPGTYEGFTVEVLPRVRPGLIDLAVHAEALAPLTSETGQLNGTRTNVLVSARLNLQQQKSLLVLSGGQAEVHGVTPANTGSCTGIFVLPLLFQSKR
jgi:hypothetical protein